MLKAKESHALFCPVAFCLPRCFYVPVPGGSLQQYGTNSYIPNGAFVFLGAFFGLKVWAGSKSTLNT